MTTKTKTNNSKTVTVTATSKSKTKLKTNHPPKHEAATTKPLTHYEEFFGNQPDHGDNARYYHVIFSGVWPDGNRGFGCMSAYSNGMLNLKDITAQITAQFNYMEATVTGWKALANRDELNSLYGSNPIDAPDADDTYYYIHYAYVDAQGYQRLGGNAVQSKGMFNINHVRQSIGAAIGAQSLAVLNWEVIESKEDFDNFNLQQSGLPATYFKSLAVGGEGGKIDVFYGL